MASTVVLPKRPKQLEDPLAHLPCSHIVDYRRGQLIYSQDQPAISFYLLIDGTVKISRLADDGHQTVIDIYQRDEFFGESALLHLPRCAEQATAMEKTKVMIWTASELDEIVLRRPRLGVALMQIMVQRTIAFSERIESFCVDTIQGRLARTLLRLAERMGSSDDDGGSVHMMPFTHDLLAQYVGTSREIVTHYMTRFRKMGCVQYSRRGITLYCGPLRAWLRSESDCQRTSRCQFLQDRVSSLTGSGAISST